jgi:voltage-gated potassium channel
MSITILVITIGVSTIGFHYIEEISWTDSLYLTIQTITTVGYGNVGPETDAGKLFSIPVIIVGVSSALTTLTLLFGPILEESLRRAVMGLARPVEYKNHVILCGRGALADIVDRELTLNQIPLVRVYRDPDTGDPKENVIIGDPSEEETLIRAGVHNAMSLITLLEDADNAFVVLEAKRLEPPMRLIAVVSDPANKAKLEEIGADLVIASDNLSARLLALSSESHFSLDFFDVELSARSIALFEISFSEKSPVIGKTIAELNIPERFGVSVVAISQDGKLEAHPDPSSTLRSSGQIIVFGERSKAQKLRRFASEGKGLSAKHVQPTAKREKPLAHEVRIRGPRMATNIFLILVIMVLNQLISPVFSAAGLTIHLHKAFDIAITMVVWASIGYLLWHVLSDFRVLVDLGFLSATGLSSVYETRGTKKIFRDVFFIAIIIILGALVSPVMGSIGGIAKWVGYAIPWICLGLLLVVLYDLGSIFHAIITTIMKRLTDNFASRLEEET